MRNTVLLTIVLALTAGIGHADVVWFDGSRDAKPPQGKLLSDNPGYWGECVLTGVDYKYEAPPDSPADGDGGSGRALLNGSPAVGGGMSGDKPLVVVFDFKRVCTFSEMDMCIPSKRAAITIETRENESAAWDKVFGRGLADCPENILQRIPLPEKPKGLHGTTATTSAQCLNPTTCSERA